MAYNQKFNPDALPAHIEPEKAAQLLSSQQSQQRPAPPPKGPSPGPGAGPPPRKAAPSGVSPHPPHGYQGRPHSSSIPPPRGQDHPSSRFHSPPPQNYGHGPRPNGNTMGRPPQHPVPSGSPAPGSLYPASGPAADDPQQLIGLFRAANVSRSGALSETELGSALVNGDYTAFDPNTVKTMVRMFDRNGDGVIAFEEFCSLWKFLAAWRELFDRFDEDRSGRISLEEFEKALTAFGYRLSRTFIRVMFSTYESKGRRRGPTSYSGNGGMSFDLFVQACISLKRITDVFKRYDDDRDGYITVSFEEFLTVMEKEVQAEPDHAQHPAQASDTTLDAEPHDNAVDTLNTTAEKSGDDANALAKTPSQAEQLGKSKIILVMGALCLSVFLAALDMTIVSTALPVMAAHFHASQSGYSWMASSYLLANSSCVPFWGKLSDIFGRKPIILISNALFLVGSLICALSNSLAMNLAGRAIQGAAGGGLIVLANITVSDLFSVRDRPMYYGLFGMTWAIAGALGPIIGGALTTKVTWRWCFYLNLPVGGVSFVILTLFLEVHTPKTRLLDGLAAIDWLGALTVIGATLMFLFGLEFGGLNFPWNSATVICLIVFGVLAFVLFGLIEWKIAKFPIIPMRLFNNRHNIITFLVCFCHASVFMAGAYYIPLYFQSVLLATPILSGVYTLPQVLSLSVVSAFIGIIIKKTGKYKHMICGGMGLMTLGFGLFIDLKPYASWPRIIIYQILAGAGTGPNFQSPLVAIQANIHPSDMATATAAFGFVRQLSAATAIVLGGVIYQNVFKQQLPKLAGIVDAQTLDQLANSFSGGDKSLIQSLPTNQQDAVKAAFTLAMSRMWIFYTCMGGLGFVLSFFIKQIELNKSHAIAKTGLDEQERARNERIAAEKAAKRGNEKAEEA
ncbi:putative MFS-type transporter C16A3,17c [Talaromyces islandicus]|uniref:Efflux pump dotC n=1 Tax=Talaromyces islandicus TaxID=28573 RepID=A0A0U1LXY9_TALIS|nr:putative MFS-type transporter C16A3,17c [Talaromyces islandicus]